MVRVTCLSALVTLLLVLLVRQVKAQMNVPLSQDISGDGTGAHVSESISSFEGNTRGIMVGLGAVLGVRVGKQFSYLNASADYAHLAGQTLIAKAFAYARSNYQLSPYLWSEVFGQMESDRIRRISLRERIGAGPRILLFRNQNAWLFFGTSYMLEYTRLSPIQANVDGSSVAHRFSNYLTINRLIGPTVALSETLYVQPRFDAPKDMYILNVTSLQFKLTSHLSSHIDTMVRYDTREIVQTKQFDVAVKNMLDLRF
jgi:hypothetical protein